METKKILIIGGIILLLIILNLNIKKIGENIICIESDKGDISIKGTCYDGDTYPDICRIDGEKILIESTCSNIGKCISQLIICDGFCNLGKCKE